MAKVETKLRTRLNCISTGAHNTPLQPLKSAAAERQTVRLTKQIGHPKFILVKTTRVILILLSYAIHMYGQSVVAKSGNIFFVGRDGRSIQVTSEGLDSQPSLSPDARKIVFVRQTPGYAIDTGLGVVENNELWITSTSPNEKPNRVFRGHPGGFDSSKDLVVAGFETPRFSSDSQKVYFVATTWATSSAIHVLDVATGKTRLLESGHSVEPIYTGRYKGYVIIDRDILPKGGGRFDEYWLFDPTGRRLTAIGQSSELESFKQKNGIKP